MIYVILAFGFVCALFFIMGYELINLQSNFKDLDKRTEIYYKSLQEQINLSIKFSTENAEMLMKNSLLNTNDMMLSLEQHSKLLTDYVNESIKMAMESPPPPIQTNKNKLN